jgi:hypothetical protein
MEIVLTLLVVSAVTGAMIGLKYPVYAVGIASLVIAAVAALALRDFDFDAAVAATFGSLIVNQIAYLGGAWVRFRRAIGSDSFSSEEKSDDRSDEDR